MSKRQLNLNVNVKTFLVTLLMIQLFALGLIGLEDVMGIEVPAIRYFVSFFYLSFIPGIIILRIFRVHTDAIRTILFSFGLSYSFLMFIGMIINLIYPLFGVSRPISKNPLVITIGIIIFILWIIDYLQEKNMQTTFSLNIVQLFSSSNFFLLLFPVLAILGAYILNLHNVSFVLIFLLVALSTLPMFVEFGYLKECIYPLLIWATAISLSYSVSLASTYIVCTDNVVEYHLANLVINNGLWDSTIYGSLNSVLPVVLLIPIFSEVCNADTTSIFKVVTPFISSLVPVGLYIVYSKVTNNDKIAFFSSFLFISTFSYFKWASLTMKQASAGFFLTLLLLLMTTDEINSSGRAILLIIFAFSLTVSHYGTSYVFMFCSIVALFILYYFQLSQKNYQNKKWGNIINPIFVTMHSMFVITWYMYTSSSSGFIDLVKLVHNVVDHILSLYIPAEGYNFRVIAEGNLGLSLKIMKYLYYIVVIFVIIGILNTVYDKSKFNLEYLSLAIPFFLANIFIFFAGAATPERMYYITSFLLAPFSVKGCKFFIERLYSKKIIVLSKLANKDLWGKVISIFLMIFLLFNVGVPSIMLKDFHPVMIYINKKDVREINEKQYLYSSYIVDFEWLSSKWLSKNAKVSSNNIFTDLNGRNVIILNCNILRPNILKGNIEKHNVYIYISYFGVTERVIVDPKTTTGPLNVRYLPLYSLVIDKNKIYTNGGSEIYYKP